MANNMLPITDSVKTAIELEWYCPLVKTGDETFSALLNLNSSVPGCLSHLCVHSVHKREVHAKHLMSTLPQVRRGQLMADGVNLH